MAVISKQEPSRTLVFKYNDQQPSSTNQNSDWKRVEEESGSQATANSKSIYKRLDCFWNHIRKIVDDQGSFKYVQLFALVKCLLSLSHGNSTPRKRVFNQ